MEILLFVTWFILGVILQTLWCRSKWDVTLSMLFCILITAIAGPLVPLLLMLSDKIEKMESIVIFKKRATK